MHIPSRKVQRKVAIQSSIHIIGLAIYETISMGTNSGAIHIGTPGGKKNVKNLCLWIIIAKIVTPINTTKANLKELAEHI